ncbi:MAG: restriction endonuclease subunit S [Mariprofundaceae bacterium]|nr:restriction endonuclease subunit S [Mariprofundaceae bacterium]
MGQELYELPEGWNYSQLGTVAKLIGGATPSKKERKYWDGDINWASVRDLNVDTLVNTEFRITHEGLASCSSNIIPKGNLVIATRVGLGKVSRTQTDVAINQDLRGVIPACDIDVDYLFFWFKGNAKFIESNGTGATVKGVKIGFIKSLQIPLPPLNEQKRIVAKLDAIFTRIDTAITHLQQTLKLSKALFASALNSALVPTGNIESPPESWSCEVLQTVSNLVSDGTHHSPKEQFHDKQDGLYKYITSKNIKFDGLKLDNVTYIKKEVHDEIYARCNPENLDQLITKDGAMTGTCCLNTLDEAFSLLSSVALVKLKRELMLPHFLNYFLQSPTGQELMIGDISGAAITRTNLKKLKAIKVPLAPMKEQQRIVSYLNSLAERTRKLEASTQEKINDLTTLKASLLDSAFKGGV